MVLSAVGGYNVLYATKDNEIVSYFVFTRSNDHIVAGTTNKDYYTIFYYTYPEYRGQGYATKMASYLLNDMSLDYESFYKTIAKSNISSIKVTEKIGFEKVGTARKQGLLHRISRDDQGDIWLYRYKCK